jgi:alkanesulfonate monooxygenase SsuD/methylene tetrahydromethanopterin reductase-like flavin-dependent oxidoreductase (luciferase family)
VRADIPIFVASLGPKNVEMTAEVADGWLPIFFHPGEAQDVWGDTLAAGRARRSPELGPLETIAGGTLAFGDDQDQAFIRDRVEAFRAAGVTYLQATPVGADPLSDAARLRETLG